MQVSDVLLEFFLTLLMFALESQDLVICLTGLTTITEAPLVCSLCILLELFDGCLHSCDAIFGENDLEAHGSDSYTQVFVITTDVVKKDFFMLFLMLE